MKQLWHGLYYEEDKKKEKKYEINIGYIHRWGFPFSKNKSRVPIKENYFISVYRKKFEEM